MKLRKCTGLFLAFLLLVSNLGLAFNVHYCGDEVASVSLKMATITPNLEDECCGIMEQKTQCCNDKVVQFQEKSDNLILKIISFHSEALFQIEEWNPFIFAASPNFKSTPITSYSCDANAPPFFKLYSQYIFYA